MNENSPSQPNSGPESLGAMFSAANQDDGLIPLMPPLQPELRKVVSNQQDNLKSKDNLLLKPDSAKD